MTNGKEVAIKNVGGIRHYNVEKIKDMTAMANVLKSFIVKQGLFTNIKGKNYAHVEGWQFAGGMMNLYPKVISVENLSTKDENKWRADVAIINMKDGKIMANGFAICSSKETNKKSFEEYAVLSMAQTRAIGKAYRNLIGWVMKLAGYEATPSEEMHKVGETPAQTVNTQAPVSDGTVHLCEKCDSIITKQENDYSMKIFGKALCREDQKGAKKK